MSTMNPTSRAQRTATPDTASARKLVYTSAFLFILGGLTLISASFAERNASHHTYLEYKSLNTTVLEDIWLQRRAFAGLKVVGDFIFCIAYLCMVPAVLILVDGIVSSAQHSSGTRLLTPCFGVVAVTIILSFLTSAGTLSVADWVSTFPAFKPTVATQHLHDGGWGPYQSLEVSYRVQTGQGLWLVIFDELALSIFFALIGWYTKQTTALNRVVHKCFPWLCCIVSVCLHLSFWFGMLRMVNWGVFMILGFVTGIASNLIFIPIWLICLGRHLHVLQVVGSSVSLLDNQFMVGNELTTQQHVESDKDDLGERI